MNIIFRVDASIEMGIGHVMRCLTLADALKVGGAQCQFVCREHSGNLLNQIAERGYQVHALPIKGSSQSEIEAASLAHAPWLGSDWMSDAQQTGKYIGNQTVDWLIADHYSLDERWERQLRTNCRKIMVIDDLADRNHDCDLLLDQTYGRNYQDYFLLVPESCELLCGTQHALLRPEFAQWRESSLRRRTGGFEHLLINLGGVDKENITGQVLDALQQVSLPQKCRITVIMGSSAPWVGSVSLKAEGLPWPTELKIGVNNIAEIMASADLSIGAAGTTSWERCCLGLPTLILVVADNQKLSARELEKSGSVLRLECLDMVSGIETFLLSIKANKTLLIELSKSAAKVCDGIGCDKVVAKLKEV